MTKDEEIADLRRQLAEATVHLWSRRGISRHERERAEKAEAELTVARQDTVLLEWMFKDCIDRKVYVRDYDEETGKYTYTCKGCLSDTPRGALMAARGKEPKC